MMKPLQILPFREPTAEEQTAKAQQHTVWRQEIRDWLIAYPFTAKLVMRLKLVMVVDTRVPTACTDGINVFVNAHFAAQCSSALRRFVIGHELYHVLLGHFMRQYGRERLCWNLAVDAEANYRLMLDGLWMPLDAVFYPAQAGRNAETIYQWLLKHPRPEMDMPFDRHGEELFAPASIDDDNNALVVDPDFAPLRVDTDMARQIIQHWQEMVLQEAQQVSSGSIPAGMKLIVNNIAKPQVNWRTTLHDFFLRHSGSQLTWNRINRRSLAQGHYLPGRQGKALSLMLAIDTSGSTQRQLQVFIAELQALLTSAEHVEIHLIECDADIHRERVINHVQELQEIGSDNGDGLTLRGGGGTDFRPVFERANDVMPECLLFLTDGYGRTPEATPDLPVLWVITEDGKAPALWGHVVRLENA
ncbi:VWA-like domain-containing protein [Vreelandella andesensis]|nr:VWA-like domain-containing protein [Halomonas andesensis]